MTTKPALGGSLAAMGVALALGAAAFVAAARGRARAA